MFSFMFGVLGSVIFWISYFGISLFAGTFIMKRLFLIDFNILIGKDKPGGDILYVITPIVAYLFWPVFIIWYLFKFILVKICIGSFRSAVIFADKNMPEIKVSKQQKD